MPGSSNSSDEDRQSGQGSQKYWRGCGGCAKHVSDEFLGFWLRPEEALPEVEIINNYAVFTGYLSMVVRGLGFLVVTWTTVVLLGGFVSVLGKKDFWCLTVITLSQTVGAFDVFLHEKLGSIRHGYRGLVITGISTIFDSAYANEEISAKYKKIRRQAADFTENATGKIVVTFIIVVAVIFAIFGVIVYLAKLAVQAVLFASILLPLATLYVLGLYISTSISLWRLIQHDYGDDGGANMKTALNVLYSLAVLQGLVFCYKIIFSRHEKSMVALSAKKWTSEAHFDGAVTVTWDYLRETKNGCEKDPSFARGRNLVTYAMDLIKSRSPDSYRSGTRVLHMLLDSERHSLLICQLIVCGGSNHVLRKLLGTLGLGSPYYGETRRYATDIVARLAYAEQIRLAQFPGAIQLISSMLHDTSQVEDGLLILGHLADDEGNRMVMRNTLGLLSSIMAPLGGLHSEHCHAWDRIAGLISQLVVAAPGGTGLKLRREISHNDKAVKDLESILKCCECGPQERIKANDILADLSMEMTSNEDNGRISSFQARKEENLISILVYNFIYVNREDSNWHRRVDFAGRELAELSRQSKSSVQLILRANDLVATNLIRIVEKKAYESGTAEKILNNLFSHYSKDDECFDGLKKALTNAMSKVLTEMLPQLEQEIRTETEAHNNIVLSAPGEDLEIVCESRENARNWEKGEGRKLKEILTFFCLLAKICNKLISADDQDLSRQFDEIVAVMDSAKPVRTFASLVEEAQEALEEVKAQEARQKEARRRS